MDARSAPPANSPPEQQAAPAPGHSNNSKKRVTPGGMPRRGPLPRRVYRRSLAAGSLGRVLAVRQKVRQFGFARKINVETPR
jgi:hypothetical protein